MKRSERHERDRQRLLRCGKMIKKLLEWKENALTSWHQARRWSTAWKAAAKKWQRKAMHYHRLRDDFAGELSKAMNECDCLRRDLAKRTEVRDDLRIELMDLASANLEILAERDALAERLGEVQSVVEEARKGWLSPSTSPLDVLDKLAAALAGGEGE